jgi:hypothetical protein
MYHDVA